MAASKRNGSFIALVWPQISKKRFDGKYRYSAHTFVYYDCVVVPGSLPQPRVSSLLETGQPTASTQTSSVL